LNPNDSPVLDALLRQTHNPDGLIDLVPLWRAAGRPRGKSPRQRYGRTGEIIAERGKGPDGAVLVELRTAWCYAGLIDDDLGKACCDVLDGTIRADPAGFLMRVPNSVGALVAIPYEMAEQGVGAVEAADRLVAEVVGRTAGLGAWEQETTVAEVQRAVRGEDLRGPEECSGPSKVRSEP
jgi:hypothetical protein